jgi:hypothetical protein
MKVFPEPTFHMADVLIEPLKVVAESAVDTGEDSWAKAWAPHEAIPNSRELPRVRRCCLSIT